MKRRGQTVVENNLHSGADMDLDKSKKLYCLQVLINESPFEGYDL